MTAGELRDLFEAMIELRAFEEIVAEAHRDGQLPGLLHLAIGAEAVTVGVVAQLGATDRVYSSHRPHAHFLAADRDARAILAELAGRESGLCKGRGGSMHLMGKRAMLATGIVGGTLPIAVGHALLLEEGAVAVAFFGDGAVQTGGFHESLNLAALWRAPVLFVCENNGMAEFSSREEHTTVEAVADYGSLYRLPAVTVDGTDVELVGSAAVELLERVRRGDGPALLECRFTRLRPHYEGDWRAQGESDNDAVAKIERRLVELGVSTEELAAVREAQLTRVRELLSEVLGDPAPRPEDDAGLVFASPLP